jgi:sulfate permease, SulP family
MGPRIQAAISKSDLLAGLTVAVVAVPQSMAYALIAGLPVQYGLYASIVPTIIACLWGSSAHLITGPTTAVSLVVFSVLGPLAPSESIAYLELAFLLALLVGGIQVAMGFARLGTLLNFVSHAVLIGFTTGAATLIAFKQLPGLLGIRLDNTAAFHDALLGTLTRLHQTEPITLALGLVTILVVAAMRKYRPAWPGPLMAMVLVGSLVALMDLDHRGVAMVGAIPRHLPPFQAPSLDALAHIGQLAPGALAIAILGLVEAVSISKAIAEQTRQRINLNQEFVGQGLANISAALFSGYAGSGSFTRSAVNFRAGAKTPVSGIVSAIAVTAQLCWRRTGGQAAHSRSGRRAHRGGLRHDPQKRHCTHHPDYPERCGRAGDHVPRHPLSEHRIRHYAGVLLSIGLHLAATAHPRIHSVVPDLRTGKMVGSVHGETCCQMDMVNVEGSLFSVRPPTCWMTCSGGCAIIPTRPTC